MKNFFLVSFLFFTFSAFSQGEEKKAIHWLTINKAEEFAKKYKRNMLIFFYRPGCPECHKMKTNTLKDPEIVKLINENFYPVMINGRTKDTIIFNGIKYYNQQPVEHGATFRHDLYHELAQSVNSQYYWPYTVIIDGKLQHVATLPGFFPKERLQRSLQKFIK